MGKKKRTTQPAPRIRRSELIDAISEFLTINKEKQFNYKQIAAALNVQGEEGRRLLLAVLDKMRDDELVLESSRGRYRINDRGLILEGRFERRSNGKNFFVPDDDGNIVNIAERNSMHAMNGDQYGYSC